jgi:DNA phosphorothioation-dependent restriction protein DptG
MPASKEKDFGKFIVDVFMDDTTKDRFLEVFDNDENPLDDIVSNSYLSLKILKRLKSDREYSRIFVDEFDTLFTLMNKDFQAALSSRNDAIAELEFLLSYYLFIYLSQIALRFDADLDGKNIDNYIAYFKASKESVSEDRECVLQGWRKIERKTAKVFKHLIVLNMLNCHDNSTKYVTYSDLYSMYESNIEYRGIMDEAIDYILEEYTKKYTHDTDTPGVVVDFGEIEYPSDNDERMLFKKKVKYLFQCVSFQLDSKNYRQNVVSYVAGNYNHILKMRFVKSWGQLGHMMMISNEDLIHMIRICQSTSDRMDEERGIQIGDLFREFDKRRLFFDGKTKQFIIDYLINVNLIDSKCDSEEAQYVKRIQ